LIPAQFGGAVGVGLVVHPPVGHAELVAGFRRVRVGFEDVIAQSLPQLPHGPGLGPVDQPGRDQPGLLIIQQGQRLAERAGPDQVDPARGQGLVDHRQPLDQILRHAKVTGHGRAGPAQLEGHLVAGELVQAAGAV